MNTKIEISLTINKKIFFQTFIALIQKYSVNSNVNVQTTNI